MINTPRENVIDSLKSYGEFEVADTIMSFSDEEYKVISEKATECAYTGMMFAKAFALAAVECIEGKKRDLKQNRRTFPK